MKTPNEPFIYWKEKIKENFRCKFIKIDEVKSYLGRWRIPKQLRGEIIKIMINLELLKRKNRFYLEVTNQLIQTFINGRIVNIL